MTWTNATTFTTADLAASHVRFVHDGSVTAPTFSIQANDGAALNNLSNLFVGSVLFNNVNHAPVATPVTLAAGTEDTAYIITAASLLAGRHRRRRPGAVDHGGQRGQRRRQHRQQRQRHLDLYAGGQRQRPGQLQLHRLRRHAERQLDRQPDARPGQRAPVATPVDLAAIAEDTAYTYHRGANCWPASPTSTARRCRSRR